MIILLKVARGAASLSNLTAANGARAFSAMVSISFLVILLYYLQIYTHVLFFLVYWWWVVVPMFIPNLFPPCLFRFFTLSTYIVVCSKFLFQNLKEEQPVL